MNAFVKRCNKSILKNVYIIIYLYIFFICCLFRCNCNCNCPLTCGIYTVRFFGIKWHFRWLVSPNRVYFYYIHIRGWHKSSPNPFAASLSKIAPNRLSEGALGRKFCNCYCMQRGGEGPTGLYNNNRLDLVSGSIEFWCLAGTPI